VLYLQSLLLELGITEDNALAGSEELPGWHLYPSVYEEGKCSSSTRIKNEDTLTIDTVLDMLKCKDRCFKT
jgi:hypothetical protein